MWCSLCAALEQDVGYRGSSPGITTALVFLLQNSHSSNGSSSASKARRGDQEGAGSAPLLICLWSADNKNRKQLALTAAALILSQSPREPGATHPLPFPSLHPSLYPEGPDLSARCWDQWVLSFPSDARGLWMVPSGVLPRLTHP